MNFVSLHQRLERNSGWLIFGILLVSSIGGLVQIVPSLFEASLRTPVAGLMPYAPLELIGRDVYIRESCSTCHSQQVRPLLSEIERYGPYSMAGEFAYDRPFLWGSKRTGPDLHRIGGKYTDQWHRLHLLDPRSVVPQSIMPAYAWLGDRAANHDGSIERRLRALRRLGHPYSDETIAGAAEALENATELDALIAYLQGLGTTPPADGATE
jgi:cytochrome c oxidase cbb3-type subunit 2